jgi:hypothetical protein
MTARPARATWRAASAASGPGGPREWRAPCSGSHSLGMLICRNEYVAGVLDRTDVRAYENRCFRVLRVRSITMIPNSVATIIAHPDANASVRISLLPQVPRSVPAPLGPVSGSPTGCRWPGPRPAPSVVAAGDDRRRPPSSAAATFTGPDPGIIRDWEGRLRGSRDGWQGLMAPARTLGVDAALIRSACAGGWLVILTRCFLGIAM